MKAETINTSDDQAASSASGPSLYNWVRAINKISLISACYTALTVSLCIIWAIYLRYNNLQVTNNFSLIISILSTILFTLGLRKTGLRKLADHFKIKRSFEFILAFWCLTLILVHLECQLLALAVANQLKSDPLVILTYIIIFLIIKLSWPRLKDIQHLLSQ